MTTQPLCILGENVVEDYKYLVVHLDNRLNWGPTLTPYTRRVWANYFQRRLRSFCACSKVLEIFSQSVVASALFFAEVCLGSIICIGNFNSLNKQVQKASSIIGCKLHIFEEIVDTEQTVLHYVNLAHSLSHHGQPSPADWSQSYNIYKYTL